MLLPFVVSPAFAGKPNVLLICIDDLRPELGCYGVDYVKSPQIDALAAESRVFGRHFVQAPTCGASRYALLTGTYGPADNHALFLRSKKVKKDASAVSPSMPAWFRQHGYQTVSVGKVSHHPGGFGGKDWDDEAELEMPLSWDRSMMPSGEWGHPRGAMHGLANGEIRKNSKECALFQAVEGPDTIYPDGLITKTALEQLTTLASDEKPFFLTVGLIRPHLPFGAPLRLVQVVVWRPEVLPAVARRPAGGDLLLLGGGCGGRVGDIGADGDMVGAEGLRDVVDMVEQGAEVACAAEERGDAADADEAVGVDDSAEDLVRL